MTENKTKKGFSLLSLTQNTVLNRIMPQLFDKIFNNDDISVLKK